MVLGFWFFNKHVFWIPVLPKEFLPGYFLLISEKLLFTDLWTWHLREKYMVHGVVYYKNNQKENSKGNF